MKYQASFSVKNKKKICHYVSSNDLVYRVLQSVFLLEARGQNTGHSDLLMVPLLDVCTPI